MRTWADLPEGWEVWTDEDGGRTVLVYRPDVFDGEAYDPGCVPTIYLTHGPPADRRPTGEAPAEEAWNVTLFLEPEVPLDERPTADSREAAVDAAVDLAERFASGAIDPRDPYQVPREAYLERLAALTGDG